MIQDLISEYDLTVKQLLFITGIAIAVAVALFFLTILLLRRYSRRKDNFLEINTHKKFISPVLISLLSIAISIVISAVDTQGSYLKPLNHITNLVIIFSVSWLLIKIIRLGKKIVLNRYDVNDKDNLKARKVYTQFKIIERILIAIVIVIALAVALMTFEGIRRIGVSLFASAGVAGIILGFAAQKLIANVLAGFQIAIAQPIRLDDVVIVEGEWGWIEEINLTYVVVRIWDKRRLIVPTTHFIEKAFQNWTRESAEILGTVFIYADYTVPIDKLREELSRLLKTNKHWDGNVNNLQVTNANDKTLELRALMSAADSPSAWELRVFIREHLVKYLQENHPECLPRTRLMMEKED